ncbi:helix-turn-helix domain-containing protein [Streptomyces flaveolus]|uniref:helix-turn-helix domain-containing protein n=1 Tax=Streptomyces flaveolus TaxID=67297 RepID=UPI0036F998E7
MTGLAPECQALTEGLNGIRARTGLSLAALAARTPYSKSSWERYLNGKKPVPRQAVEMLCAIAGEPAGRLLALWELADAEWSGRAGSARPPASTAHAPGSAPGGADKPPQARRRLLAAAAGSAGVAAAAAAVMMSVWATGTGPPPTSLGATALDPTPGCHGKACDGKDPDLMNCGLPGRADSLGSQHRTASGAGMEIRYSQVCAAGWGRIWHAKVGDALEISAADAQPRRVVIKVAADTTRYGFTPMIGNPDRADLLLCFLPKAGTGRQCVHS